MAQELNETLASQLPHLTGTIQLFESLSFELDAETFPDAPFESALEASSAGGLPDADLLVRSSAMEAARSSPLKKFLARFSSDEDEARTSIKDVYNSYKEASTTLEEYQDVVNLILGSGRVLPDNDVRILIYNYLTKGKCKTRLGSEIIMPEQEGSDWSLYALLGIIRIVNESVYDSRFANDLPWIAEDNSSAAERFKKYELQASNLGDRIGSTLGRAASVTAVSLINPVLKLPDEATIAISYISGIQARKVAEMHMHRFLVANPAVV